MFCVLFWALDRFSREGMVPTIMHLQRLAACGVGFHSFTEAHLATDNELVRNILLALLASLAKVEAQKISERTKAGMARARAKGKRIGRPAIDRELQQRIADRAAEVGAYAAAKELGVDRKTAMKYRIHDSVCRRSTATSCDNAALPAQLNPEQPPWPWYSPLYQGLLFIKTRPC